jgi:integrase
VADLVEVLADTGMRLGEALALKYEDVNFASNLISIWINKGDRPRSTPMTQRVRSILQTRQVVNPVRPFNMKAHQVSTAWDWVRKETGLDQAAVTHSLRHTCASRMVNAGVDLYLVKEILGHSTIQITERYAHLAPNKLASAISALEH